MEANESREADDTDIRRSAKNKRSRQVEIDDFKWLMGSKQGRRVMWRLLDKAGVYRTSFTGNSETFFKEGMRNIGLMLVAEIHAHCPEAYALMLTEAKAPNQ